MNASSTVVKNANSGAGEEHLPKAKAGDENQQRRKEHQQRHKLRGCEELLILKKIENEAYSKTGTA